MNPKKEARVARGIIEICKFKNSYLRKAYFISFASLLFSAILIVYVIFYSSKGGSLSSYLLIFFAGVWLVWAYAKYTEAIGLQYISNYLDINKAKERYKELGGNIDKMEPEMTPYLKIAISIVSWAVIGFLVVYVTNYFKNL